MAPKVLLIEDEQHLAFSLQINLEAEGFEVVTAENGETALALYHRLGPFAVIILDVMLPDRDGFAIAEHIRRSDARTGILMLTARASDEDRLRGLRLGADDYITKPFHLQELLMRVKRMAERAALFQAQEAPAGTPPACREFGPFRLDTEALILHGPRGPQELTALEADMLAEFMAAPLKVLSRKYLLAKVWGLPGKIETRTIDNFVMRLRRLLEEDPSHPRYLLSVRGRGYRLTQPSEANAK